MQLGQQLWTRPVYPHPDDEEFDQGALDSSWLVRNVTDGAAGSFSSDSVDVYDTTFSSGNVVRTSLNPDTRRSWLLMQPPNNKTFFIYKAFSPPTNVLIISRMKFNQYHTTMVSNDRGLGLTLFANDGGIPDVNNRLEVYLNESDSTVQAQKVKVESGSTTEVTNSTNVTQEGQALEYVAVQKRSTSYDFWVGTVSGNWIWLGSFTSSQTTAYVGFYVRSSSSSNPGVGVFGIDFIRFKETVNFLY